MVGLLLTLALLAAVGVMGWRRWHTWNSERQLPGATPTTAIAAPRFDDIEDGIARLRCPCGGRYRVEGDGPLQLGERRLRVVQVECGHCEKQRRIHFDVTLAFH